MSPQLVEAVDRVLEALVAHDAGRAGLAPGARYTENGQPLAPGQGLWATASGLADERLSAVDPQTGQAAVWTRVTEYEIPGLLALRLRLGSGGVSELELCIIRQERPGPTAPPGELWSLASETMFMPRPLLELELDQLALVPPEAGLGERLPAERRRSREQMIAAVDAYREGLLAQRSDIVPLAPDCVRRENGVLACGRQDAPPLDPAFGAFRLLELGCAEQLESGAFGYVGGIRGQSLVVDEERGLVFAIYLFDHPGTRAWLEVEGAGRLPMPERFLTPTTSLAPHLFKIDNGAIRWIEAVVKPVPYRMGRGWETALPAS